MTKIKYQMSNVNRVNLMSERTSGAPPIIFIISMTHDIISLSIWHCYIVSAKSCLTVSHFSYRLASLHPPAPEVEEGEKIALARLPSLAEEEVVVVEQQEKKVDMEGEEEEETGDGDSAIHLDCLQESVGQFDSSDDVHSPNTSPRRLQRSVSDVVGCQMLTSRRRSGYQEECFPSPLYRGFLLRHQRRQKESRETEKGRETEFQSNCSNCPDPGHLGATATYNVNSCPKIRHLGGRYSSDARNCSSVGHFECRSDQKLRNCPHQALSLSIPVVREDELGGGRAKKKTTIIIGSPWHIRPRPIPIYITPISSIAIVIFKFSLFWKAGPWKVFTILKWMNWLM